MVFLETKKRRTNPIIITAACKRRREFLEPQNSPRGLPCPFQSSPTFPRSSSSTLPADCSTFCNFGGRLVSPAAAMEIGGGGGAAVSGGGGRIDPSKLHLKKELTQIRKAARALRDPGTTTSWRSPINSARSLRHHHYGNGNAAASSSTSTSSPDEQFPQVQINGHSNYSHYSSNNNSQYIGSNGVVDNKNNVTVRDKEKKVFLYNWRSRKSDRGGSEDYAAAGNSSDLSVGGGAAAADDSKSDTCLSERILKCRDAAAVAAVRRKSRRGNGCSVGLKLNSKLNVGQRRVLEGLVDRSDETDDYSNSEDLRRESTLSPLLVRLKKSGLPCSSTKVVSRGVRKGDDSISHSTPAMSASSYNRYGVRNPSVAGSWDVATGSLNDADDEVDDRFDFPGRQGCGISCCWSRKSTPKSRGGYGSCCSPSLSDTLRRRGGAIFCGRHRRGHSLGSNKRGLTNSRIASQYRVPLLTNAYRGSSVGSEDENSENFGELDLEALSRLDGRRWSSSCRSQEGLENIATNGESSPENAQSLSHKYRPMFFDEVIGQNIVVQSLMSAISRGRIAPIYLFQGPRGTGKTSTARIFAAALNCIGSNENKPCGVCRQCADFISGKSRYLVEVNGSNKKGVNSIKNHLKSLSAVLQFTVFVIDECHLLPSKTWLTFLQLLEKLLPNVVFILITTDVDNVPRTILSRCQKHIFNKISHGDIVACLAKIADDEKLDVDSNALELIASNADGSLRDAETMLDQLSLFGKRITVSLVNELIGVVSDEKLLDLLELAMSSNATETVIRARELLDSGVDPIVLMSQLATLIVDIIAGTYSNVDKKLDSFLGGRNLSERELGRLKHALTLLSDAEKHLRVSNERSTWFTATLLQLGSMPSPELSHSGSSRRESSKTADGDHSNTLRETIAQKHRIDNQLTTEESTSHRSFSKTSQRNSSSKDNLVRAGTRMSLRCANSEMLTETWLQSIDKCHSKTLRQLLHSHGRLVSITETKGNFVAHIAFDDRNIKRRAEGFLSSITNAFEIVLRQNVEVKIILLPDSGKLRQENETTGSNAPDGDEPIVPGKIDTNSSKDGKASAPAKRMDSIIREQRLETAWLQTMEKAHPGAKPERNQVLPQDVTCPPNEVEARNSGTPPLSDKINARRFADGTAPPEEQTTKGINHFPISPSLLHNNISLGNNNCNRDNMGYESGAGGSSCLCWNNARNPRRGKAKHGTHLRSSRKNNSARFPWLAACLNSKSRGRDRFGHPR
ncbi:protein STICHEL-like 1 [Andrographis paniculata]|uniref:protein STICHEL-like 1 n=1 Tax=Andrographis paniculata TaxID=175694 RepID=UPI0021E784C5|nr:protein STICHEL-like 1 [Andrographis paniculata]